MDEEPVNHTESPRRLVGSSQEAYLLWGSVNHCTTVPPLISYLLLLFSLSPPLSLSSSICLQLSFYHYFGSEEGGTELVSHQSLLVCVCVCLLSVLVAVSQECCITLWTSKNERKRDTQSSFFFSFLYSASAQFSSFLLLCFVSFIHSLLSPPL